MSKTLRSHEMEEIDLSDRRGLIAMAEIYSGGAAAYTNNAFDENGSVNLIHHSGKDDITKILHNTDKIKINGINSNNTGSVAKSLPSSPTKMAVVSAQNGTTMTTTTDSVKFRGSRNPTKKFSCSYLTFLILFLIILAILLFSILITYHLTKNSSMTLTKNDESKFSTENQTTPTSTETVKDDEINGPTPEELRLPKTLEPIWYNLTMRVYVPGFVDIPKEKILTFSGALIIKFKVKESTKKIELNALHLDLPTNSSEYAILIEGLNPKLNETTQISSENIKRRRRSILRSNSGINITKITVNETLEKVIFDLDGELQQGKEYYFQFRFAGPISNKLAGLYLTTYQDPELKTHYAAVTQMEPTDARRMVPCFDEPEFKAIWKIKVYHPTGSRAVSNAKEIIENEIDDKMPEFLYTTFDETPKMSSYLLAIVVSDFEFIEGHTKRGTRFRIWSRKEAINETKFALEGGVKVLEFYEKYFDIDFPLQKQDMMAFPDFGAGAMENWGLVTYREKALLYNEKVYQPIQKQYVATVVAHELAHQWFGNLVTMKWWDDLWLNEGFATLVEYSGADAIDERYKMDDFFINDAMDEAFARDSMATSHPLIFPIEKAEDVSEAFDGITYQKGASVLRMLKTVIGEDNFKHGLHIYLSNFSYDNAEHADLWTALTEAVPSELKNWDNKTFDVDDFAKKWTEQMGFPLVTVTTTENGLKLTQKRFKMDENAIESPKYRNPKYWYNWDVPIWYTVDGKSQPMKWLHSEEEINLENKDSLVFINSESNGFYRVKYDAKQMAKINKKLFEDPTSVNMRSRARYIDDSFTLAQAGIISYEEVLEMSRYLAKEMEFVPFMMAVDGFHTIAAYFGDEPESEHLRKYLKNIYLDHYNRVKDAVFTGNHTDDYYESQLNVLVVAAMCELKHNDCTKRALTLYQEQFTTPCQADSNSMASQCSRVPVDLRMKVYCLGVRYGNDDDWERMLKFFGRESVQVERERLMAALGCSRDTFTLKKLLKMAIDINDTVIRLQDKATVFGLIGGQTVGEPIVFEYFMRNWNQLYNDLKDQQTLLKRFVQASLQGKTERRAKEIEEFLATNKATTNNLDVFKQQLELIKTNAKWMDKNYDKLVEWFKNENKKEVENRTKHGTESEITSNFHTVETIFHTESEN